MSADSPGQREVAYRLFAAEYDDADYSYSESDEERAPNYVVTPTGARVNRLFVVGVLTEVEAVSDDVLRGRVVDPTGAFVLYAGQYQPDEQAALERIDPPAFVAVTGKARTFQPEDGDRVYTSIRPESINTVDQDTRDRWTVQAAEQTLRRVAHAATALSTGLAGEELREELEGRGIDPALADGITRALSHYGTTPTYLDAVRELALDAARVVAGQRDAVRELTVAPDDPGDVSAADLLDAPDTATVDDRPTDAKAAGTTTDRERTAATGTESGTETDVPATEVQADSETTEESDEKITPADSTAEATDDTTTPDPAAEATDDTTTPDPAAEPTDDTTTPDPTEEPAETAAEPGTAEGSEQPGEFEPGEFDLPDEVREEVEEEYGTDFQSGTQVDEPGAADIETPDEPGTDDDQPEPESPSETAPTANEDAETPESEPEPVEGDTAAEPESDGMDDPQEAVLAVMRALDDGDGADRAAVVDEARDRHGLTAEEVEDAIQDALMDGQCYEPDESSLKPI